MERGADPFASGERVRVRYAEGLTVVGRLYGTVVRAEPSREGYYQVRLDGPVVLVKGRRIRAPGRSQRASPR